MYLEVVDYEVGTLPTSYVHCIMPPCTAEFKTLILRTAEAFRLFRWRGCRHVEKTTITKYQVKETRKRAHRSMSMCGTFKERVLRLTKRE